MISPLRHGKNNIDAVRYGKNNIDVSVEWIDKFNQSQNGMTPQAQGLQHSGRSMIGKPMRRV